MAYRELYEDQVRLLIDALPAVAAEKDFALKGGTAINLFVRDLPRLSVDIDLTYLPVADRETSLKAIDAGMRGIADRLLERAGVKVNPTVLKAGGIVHKLSVARGGVQIKIEITPVLRGCVFEPQRMPVSERVEAMFGFAETAVVSFQDLFAGKLVAALDRQHPRDLFDVRGLLDKEGLEDKLRRAFLIYMIAHHRPMHEVLDPALKEVRKEFERSFEGMTPEPVALDDLLATRERMIKALVAEMPETHRKFLVGFEAGAPDWALIDLTKVAELPAVKWRQQNLDSLPKARRDAQVEKLKAVLGL